MRSCRARLFTIFEFSSMILYAYYRLGTQDIKIVLWKKEEYVFVPIAMKEAVK